METARTESVAEVTRAKWIWGGVVIGLLGMQIIMCVVAIGFATSDPSWMVVPDYHARALGWDESRAAQQASDALGWTSILTFAGNADVYGNRGVTLRLHDRNRTPIDGAQCTLFLYHHARARELQEISLTEVEPKSGVYQGVVRIRRSGLWELRLQATRGEDEFLLTEQREIEALRDHQP